METWSREESMIGALARNWGWVVLRGVIAVVFGLLTLFSPGLTLATLVLLFGVYAVVDGLLRVVSAMTNRRNEPHPVALLAGGLLGIAVGLVTFVIPTVTAVALLALVAAWAIVTGVVEVAVAFWLRTEIVGEWLFALAGVLGVAFGVILILAPTAGALALALYVGVYAMVVGVEQIALGFGLRSWGRRHVVGPTPPTA